MTQTLDSNHDFRSFFRAALLASLCIWTEQQLQAQIYVANHASGTIGEYTLSGSPINTSFISGLTTLNALTISGNNMFVSQGNATGTIAEFDITTGNRVNSFSTISGTDPHGMVVLGNDLFVADTAHNTVQEYTTTGTLLNASFISGLNNPACLVSDGNYWYVSSFSGGTVGKYTLSGTPVNTSLIGGLGNPGGLAVDGEGDLFVSTVSKGVGEYTTGGQVINAQLTPGAYNSGNGLALDGEGDLFVADNYGGAGGNFIAEYTTSGQVINASFITGLQNPVDIDIVEAVPEPSTALLAVLGLTATLGGHRLSKRCSRSGGVKPDWV
jgi:hypothetical protein